MHEMALARNIVDAVIDTARLANARQVKTIYLTVGVARDIIDDLFEGLIKYLSKDTLAQDAELVIVRTPLTVCCDSCHGVYPIDYRVVDQPTACPFCGNGSFKLNTGMEMNIQQIEVV